LAIDRRSPSLRIRSVSSPATAENEQLRSRFCHLQVATENRHSVTRETPDRFSWFKHNFGDFCMLGRNLMQHRLEFARLAMGQMNYWIESKALSDCEHRARIVHGATYASFAALAAMLERERIFSFALTAAAKDE